MCMRIDPRCGASCLACGPGRFAHNTSFICAPCPPGLVSASSATVCAVCEAGHAANPSASYCEECAVGRAGGGIGGACSPCNVGEAPNAGRTQCRPCVGGDYADATLNRCEGCLAGHAPEPALRASCIPCAFGSYRSTADHTVTDSSSRATESCSRCEPGSEPNAFSAATHCLGCMDGYASDGAQCLRCPANSAPARSHDGMRWVAGSECTCAGGYLLAPPTGPGAVGSAPLTCSDIDECAVGDFRGICRPTANYTR